MYNYTDIAPFLKDWEINYDYINSLPNEPKLYINGASEHYGDGTLEDLAKLVPNHTVLSHYHSEHTQFHPYWYHWSVNNFENLYKQNIANDRKTYRLSCLNGVSRTHRILNYIWLNPTDDMYFTMANQGSNRDWLELPIEVKQEWNTIKHTLSQNYPSQETFGFLTNLACDDSYVQLVTETTVEPKIFVSEKTWKPIASGQLFLILGNQGIIKHLRDQGIDCFDDIIDHSYDLEEDAIERIKKIHTSVRSLLKEDLLQINIATKQRRIKNAGLFWSQKLYGEPNA